MQTKKFKSDKIRRVLDSSTVQLEKQGNVSLQTVRGAGGTYVLPDCFTFSASYKLRQLLPKGSKVRLINIDELDGNVNESSNPSVPKRWIVREDDQLLVNQELVRTGFAFVRKGSAPSTDMRIGMTSDLKEMEQNARQRGMGIYKSCETSRTSSDDSNAQSADFVAEFEPLEYTTEVEYDLDGGKEVVVGREGASATAPSNPGDTKGCSDFTTYEDALRYYERYFPYYGDVALLDRRGDGIPCRGLPHTKVGEKYRLKRPSKVLKNT